MSGVKIWLAVYRKFVVALIGFLTVLGIGLADEVLTPSEVVASVVAGLSALGVGVVRNKDVDDV
jgi:hypothetical protein